MFTTPAPPLVPERERGRELTTTGAKALGGLGGISLGAQTVGTLIGIVVALVGGGLVYGGLKALVGIRLDAEAEFEGADLAIHKISATPERESSF